MSIKNIKNITLEEAFRVFQDTGICFIIRDGKLKGFIK